jgi:hypothetical protein
LLAAVRDPARSSRSRQYPPTGAVDVSVGGQFDLGSGFTTRFLNNNYQIRDVLGWMKGRHSFKFGG